ncbi:LysR family transcriptional regulator [Massilia sp. TS11]|uniref:LysR family transcriptional regulator n=1 Tax=Massilia sp. TS11 TaxID=2908003 RepID=UPI001ED9EEB4|nr:LysR family transcriptional regulator [Massilia sp. TS11]MCG2586073.1 LysR family transcriptional regulator [Massilia sp. TS11]
MLERVHLQLLREVERQGSLTAAAEVLCLTQSALSHTVKKLEGQLGTALWLREGRHLRLTQAGRYLLGLAERLLPQFEYAEQLMGQYAQGRRGALRLGMECHPCYQWLLKIVAPYLRDWPDVDVDVKQKFQFGGLRALLGHEIDVLVTPDPLPQPGLRFIPVFDYEQVLVVSARHALAGRRQITPAQLAEEVLITYPVDTERLDVYQQFLLPAGYQPRERKTIETTDIMLEMVACGRGVAALPGWLAKEYARKLELAVLRLGRHGIPKQIHLGVRESDLDSDYLHAFIALARDKK